MKKKVKENYLERIPEIKLKKWSVLDDGMVELVVENYGFYNTLAQKLYHKPRFSFIKLDEYGSCVWQEIDGKKSIYEIGQILSKRHQGANDKLYERLAAYFGILEQHKYIRFVDKAEK